MRLTSTLLGLSCGLLMACGGGGSTTCDPTTATGTDYKYATNSLLLPVTTSYAIDIDGDGNPDNALKTLLAPLSQFVDLQMTVNMATAQGEAVVLADVKTSDLTASSCASVTMSLANKPTNAPKFDGSDTFTVDTAAMATPIGGPIKAGVINTTLPIDMPPAISSVPTLTLALAIAGGNLNLKLWGAHMQGTVSPSGVMNGQLHGVILNTDIQNSIIPAVAMLVTSEINKDPTSGTVQTIIGIFEDPTKDPSKTKCMVAADCCHTTPATCKILPSEVGASPLVGSLLTPDVLVHDATGNWKPSAANPATAKDALSVGIGFTSVKANF